MSSAGCAAVSPASVASAVRECDVPPSPAKTSKVPRRERFTVPIVFTAFVVLRAMDRVFLIRVLKIMGDSYATALMNLYWPICVQLVTACITVAYALKKRCATGDDGYGVLAFLSPFSERASSRGCVPISYMAIFAFWDQLNAAVTAIPSVWIAKADQTAMTNTAVVWTALIAYFYLGSRFKQVHYAGCLLILMSCLVAINVQLSEGGLPKPQDASGRVIDVSTTTMLICYTVYLVGVIPQGISNCYKQKVSKMVDLDLMWATFWCGNFQIVWGILMYGINWIPYPVPGGTNSASPATLGSDLVDSWTCFTGSAPKPSDWSCSTDSAWFWFLWYLVCNVFFNLLMLWLTKHLSATWASIGNVLCGDLFGVFGQFSVVSGKASQVMPLAQWLALALSSMAMWVYNIEDETDADGKVVYGVQQADVKDKLAVEGCAATCEDEIQV